jgi:signal peptidase I
MNPKLKEYTRKTWKFFWKDESIWSWVANIIVAFLIIRYIFYPILGVILGTSFPIVAVVSESMEHGLYNERLCGTEYLDFRDSYDNYWQACGSWYENKGITKSQFREFPFPNGFNKGDVIILWRAHKKNLAVGDVLIFQATKPQPIIHRIVKVFEDEGKTFYQTKGDHNQDSHKQEIGEHKIGMDRVYGQGILRVPYLGWLKILFVDAVAPLGLKIVR